jgi:8-oxo-dGTP diphosphatase
VKSDDFVHVVVAAIIHNDKVLIARRLEHLHQGGKWEFPGGKVEPGEPVERALGRELHEELGITPQKFRPLIKIHHSYPDKNVFLDVWRVESFSGVLSGREGQDTKWVAVAQLSLYEFPDANLPIFKALNIPSSCAITPAESLVSLEKLMSTAFNDSLILLRQPALNEKEYGKLAAQVAARYPQARHRIMLTRDIAAVEKYGFAGVHYSSRFAAEATSRPIGTDYLFSISCHDEQEFQQAITLDADFVFLSPVKSTASHPQARLLGWERFSSLCESINCPVFALGGLGPKDLETAWRAGAQGVAGIRSFWL